MDGIEAQVCAPRVRVQSRERACLGLALPPLAARHLSAEPCALTKQVPAGTYSTTEVSHAENASLLPFAKPMETNMLCWHYVIRGIPGTPYEGGYYHGKLEFSKDYPLKVWQLPMPSKLEQGSESPWRAFPF